MFIKRMSVLHETKETIFIKLPPKRNILKHIKLPPDKFTKTNTDYKKHRTISGRMR